MDPGREGASDRLHQLPLDDRDADAAPGTRGPQFRRGRRRPRGRARDHLHLRPPVVRHAASRRRRARRRQRALFRPGGDGHLRGRLHPPRARFHGRRKRLRGDAGRAVHLLPPAELRLQERRRRCIDRRRGRGRRVQRRGQGVPYQGQARGDDASQRDDLFDGRRIVLSGEADEIRLLPERRHDRQRLQAPRDEDALRDRPARPGSRRRPDGDDAVGEGSGERGNRRSATQISQGESGHPRRRPGCGSCA